MIEMLVYTLFDQVREDWLTLATPTGRYSIELVAGCESVGPGQNHRLIVGSDDTYRLVADGLDCQVVVVAERTTVPCFTNEFGDCDVNEEVDGE